MKRWQLVATSFFVLMVGMAIMSGPAWSGRGQGFRPCPYTPYQCKLRGICKPFNEEGKVVQVLTESLQGSMHPGMAVVVDIKKLGRVYVHLGPVWYLERQEFMLQPGDTVRVKGMCESKKEGKLRVMAYELTKGNYVLHLRDSLGRPSWEAWRKMGN